MDHSITDTDSWKEEIWKFGDNEKPIGGLTHREVILCALHCFKKMRFYGNQVHFYQYKINVAPTEKIEDKYHYHKTRCNNTILLFSNKLTAIAERAKELGFIIPDTFDETKKLFDQIPEATEKQETNIYHLSESIT